MQGREKVACYPHTEAERKIVRFYKLKFDKLDEEYQKDRNRICNVVAQLKDKFDAKVNELVQKNKRLGHQLETLACKYQQLKHYNFELQHELHELRKRKMGSDSERNLEKDNDALLVRSPPELDKTETLCGDSDDDRETQQDIDMEIDSEKQAQTDKPKAEESGSCLLIRRDDSGVELDFSTASLFDGSHDARKMKKAVAAHHAAGALSSCLICARQGLEECQCDENEKCKDPLQIENNDSDGDPFKTQLAVYWDLSMPATPSAKPYQPP